MKLFTAEQIRSWDRATIDNEPISSYDLMERASKEITSWIIERFDTTESILILAGFGNNGGDGLAVGRMLHEKGYNINIFSLESAKTSLDNITNINKCKSLNIKFLKSLNESKHSIIIDAIFGSGLCRDIDGKIKELIDYANVKESTRIAIDCPSGIHADKGPITDTVFKADHTLTLQQPKISFYYKESAYCIGKVHVLDIGLINSFYSSEIADHLLIDENISYITKRKKFSHKGTYGHVLIIAGDLGTMGACLLASKASLRSGCGLTTSLIPSDSINIIQTALPEVMAIGYFNDQAWSDLIKHKRFNAIAIGPGLGMNKEKATQLINFIKEIKTPLVLDADALNMIAHNKCIDLIPENSIITPHPGEFNRLFGDYSTTFDMISIQKKMSVKYQIIIVNKLANTIITDTDGNVFINTTGNPGMATAGCGDVLTGVIASLLAQGESPINSAVKGVYYHGLSGDKCKELKSEMNIIAGDVIEQLFIK